MLVAVLLSVALAPFRPQGEALARFEATLRPHPYLGRISYTRVESFAPFYLFVKRPDVDETGYYERVAGHYGPWLQELERLFVARYVEPLGLERRAGHAHYALFVLDSSGAYKDYADAAGTTGLYAARAHYDPSLGLAVTFENVYQPESRSQHRRAALHELVHALQHAYFADPQRLPQVAWFNEGLADYLSYCEGLLPPALQEPKKPDPDALELVAALAQVPGLLGDGLFPLEELVALRDYDEVERLALERSGGVQRMVGGESVTMPLFYAQSSLWTWFLHHGEGARHQPAYLRYVGAVWKGQSGVAALRDAFEGTNLEDLERAFRKWLGEASGQREGARVVIPEATRGEDTADPGATVEVEVATPSPFVPAELLPDPADAEAGLALALAEARRGALAAAERRLAGLAPEADEPLRARIERERERMAALCELRQRFFEHLAQPGARKLDAELDGHRVFAQVMAVEDGRVRLGPNRRGIEDLELERVPPLAVVELARDRKYGFEAGATAVWAYVLAGDERWKKLAPAGDPLRADAEDYSARLALARVVGTLADLAAAGPPADAAAAMATLAKLEELVREAGTHPLVHARRPALRALAEAALTRQFEERGLAACVRGKLETLNGGRVRITYAFNSPGELADFTQEGYLASHAQNRPRRDFTVADGHLMATDYACLRSRLTFQGPQRVRCKARYGKATGSFDPRLLFLLGCNDDGLVSYAAADIGGAVRVIDLAGDHMQRDDVEKQLVVGETYVLELVFDGNTFVSSVNGKTRGRVPAGPRTSGAVFLFTAADFALSVDELVVEGELTPDALRRLHGEWRGVRLAELGLE